MRNRSPPLSLRRCITGACGELAEAAEHHGAALAIRREIGDEHGTAVSINALGLLALRHRRLDDALARFGESVDIFRRRNDRRLRALLLSNLAETRYELGDLSEAVPLLEQALTIQRDIGDRGQEGNSLFFLSMTLSLSTTCSGTPRNAPRGVRRGRSRLESARRSGTRIVPAWQRPGPRSLGRP
ncbi:tetratricopeptide repeat protein [Micromonospora sp. CA-263727]|uniref:tetratricopeptide repeat protein n=1 Tax=Micromonospora sp. CA-263727 TaxID=3239967 RepID=UPI003D8EDAFC